MGPGGSPRSVHPPPAPRAQRAATCSSCSEGQAHRGSKASSKKVHFSRVCNKLSQDRELGTDWRSAAFTYTRGPRRLPGDRRDLNGPETVPGS